VRVIAYTKYDREAASTRQRVLQYIPALAAAGIQVDHRSLLDNDYVRSLATGEHWSRLGVLRSYTRRIAQLIRREDADLIWVYADLFPYLPTSFDRLVLRSGAPVVYDYDDAFFLAYNGSGSPVRRLLSGKIEKLMAGADAVIAANDYLRDHAAPYCPTILIVPTVVDTDKYRPEGRVPGLPPTIGWIGSPSTWENVRPVLPVINRVCDATGARFRVVGAGVQAERDRMAAMELVDWSEEFEIREVQGFDIGIAPLVDAPFQRGKSGYKLIQYMACGVPVIASPVGANRSILTPGSGIFAELPQQWEEALLKLVGDPQLRSAMGAAGRERAVSHYSLQSQAPRVIALFREVVERAAAERPIPARPLCVTHVITGMQLGGAETMLFRVIQGAADAEHEVIVLGGRDWYSPLLEQRGIRVHHLDIKSAFSAVTGWFRLRRLISKAKPDVVQCWMYHANLVGGIAARFAGARVVWNIRCSSPHLLKFGSRLWARVGGWLSGLIPSVVVMLSERAAEIHANSGYGRARLKVISNGFDPDQFRRDSIARTEVRNELALGDDCFVVGAVTRWDIYKDVPSLLRAAKIAVQRGVNLKLVLVGAQLDARNQEIEEIIRSLELADRIVLLGKRLDLPRVVQAFDVHAFPSASEGFGNVVAETMLSGVPNVVTDVGACALMVGSTGWIVPPGDTDWLASALVDAHDEWQDHADRWSNRRSAARERIVRHFSFKTMAAAYQDCWANVAAGGRKVTRRAVIAGASSAIEAGRLPGT